MPGRTYAAGSGYRYGFNGKENDNDVKGVGNQLDFGERLNDPRLGKWLSVDPLFSSYPHQSPYVSMSNNPINRIDPTGMGDYYSKDGAKLGSDGKTVKDSKGKMVADDKAYISSQSVIDDNTKDGKTDWDKVIASSQTQLLNVSNTDLGKFARIVSGESSGDVKESFAIATTARNYAHIEVYLL